MQSDHIEDLVIDNIKNHFGNAVKDFVIKSSTDIPFTNIVIEMSLYNYCVININVEKSTIFASIMQSGFHFSIFKDQLTESNLLQLPKHLEHEIKLRIPDKYLKAKGWI
jgi:frataxin-like iron-binding protein CyaY